MLNGQPLGEYPELDPLPVPYIDGRTESLKLWRDQFMFGYGFHKF